MSPLNASWGVICFFFSSRRRHTRCLSDWSSDVCSSDLVGVDEFLMRSWHELLVLQLGSLEFGDVPQAGEIQRCRQPVDLGCVYPELANQQIEYPRTCGLLDFETHRRSEPPAQQLALESLQEVV